MFIVCSYLSGSIGIVRKNVTKDAVMVCICIITHTIFFIIIAPVSHYRGTPRFWAFFGLFFLWVGMDGWQSVLCVGEKQRKHLGEKQRKHQGCDKWADLSLFCALERNKGVKKFPVQKI